MLFNSLVNLIILFIVLCKKSTSEVPNNTHVKITNETFSNKTLINKTESCAYPCLSICSADVFDRYEMNEDLQGLYEAEVKFYKGEVKIKDLSKYFNGNVSLPCNESTMYALLTSPNDEWTLFEDGKLYVHYDQSFRNQHQYCFDLKNIWNEGEGCFYILFVPYICSLINNDYGLDQWKNWAMVFSLPFFLLTILFHCFLSGLKSCHGKCFIMYLTNLTLTYALISYANLSTTQFMKSECLTMGYTIYFTTMAFLTWTCIISYDTYNALTGFSYSAIFCIYLGVGLVIPLLATLLVLEAQNSSMANEFKPGIELGNCAVQTKRWSAMLYYYIPHLLALIFCLFMYIKLIVFLQKHEKNATKYAGKVKTSHKRRFTIYFRLFVFMGVIWFFEILSYITYMSLKRDNFFTIMLDYFNALHGLFIFLCITCSSNLYRKAKEKCTKRRFGEHELVTTTSLDCNLDVE